MKINNQIKRKLIQFAAFGFTNSQIGNFISGKIYTGKWKQFCTPGMNCYSCPAALLSCPIGAMQAVSGSINFKFSFLAAGIVLAWGVILGRWICAFLCPFGLIQELLLKIPLPKIRLPKWMTYIKYVLLVVFVILMPAVVTNFMGIGKPAFCQYICPVGTLEGGIPLLSAHDGLKNTIGPLFGLKAAILILTLTGCIVCHRFFCKVMCPLGAVYGLLNKISLYHLDVDYSKCVGCGKCARACKIDVNPVKTPDSAECIRCGECVSSCPAKAISVSLKFNHPEFSSRKSVHQKHKHFKEVRYGNKRGIELCFLRKKRHSLLLKS